MFPRFFVCFVLFFKFGQNGGTNTVIVENAAPEPGELFLHLSNLTRCSKTQLNLRKESLTYSWDLKGFLSYYTFMKKFEQIFEIKTDEISFKSDIVDGKWFFKISKLPTPTFDDIIVSSTYSYEAKQPKKLHFYIKFSLLHNNKEIVLPVQKSTNPMVMQQRLYNRRGYSSYLEYIHTFTWPGLGHAIENMITNSDSDNPTPRNNDENVNVQEDEIFIAEEERIIFQKEEGREDVTLKFGIVAYFPTDPVYLGSENCQNLISQGTSFSSQGLARDGDEKYGSSLKSGIPPYVKHANSMLHDVRFSDVLLKAGGQVFPAHRIILANAAAPLKNLKLRHFLIPASSPVLSSLLLSNSTDLLDTEYVTRSMNNSEAESSGQGAMNEINLDPSLSSEVTEEMLRYIYTGKVTSLDKIADRLILAAHKYELPELKKMCEKILYSKIQTDNAIQMYDIGHEIGSHKISKRAFAVMKANKSKLVTQSDEFRRLSVQHPGLMFELFVTP